MARYLPAALVLGLLVATGLAFVYTELLKLEPSPIRSTHVEPLLSPICRCPTDRARISFRLRKNDVVTVTIVDSDGREVRVLAADRPVRRSQTAAFAWRGRAAGDRPAPDGIYRARVRLELAEKTIVLPNEIRVDSTPPTVRIVSAGPRTISPDGDGRADAITIRYRADEPVVTRLYVDGVPRARVRAMPLEQKITWNGRIHGRVRPGLQHLTVVARDGAGNLAHAPGTIALRIRFVELPREPRVVAPRARFVVPVDTDARTVEWRFAGGHGTGRPHPLRLTAPKRPGRYALVVKVGPHAAHEVVRVLARRG